MIKFGVIGAGRIANTFCEAVNGIGGKLYAIASRSEERASAYQKKYAFEVAYDTYEDLVNDPNVDCVYIATPHGLHFEHVMLALEHKKNVLCEKSFTLNAKQAEILMHTAKENGCFIMEAMWTRFLPAIRELKSLIDDGIIGQVVKMDVSFGLDFDLESKPRLVDPKMGGGALLDLGVYPIHFVNLFMGVPERIETHADLDARGIDNSETIIYHYPNGIAYLASSILEDLPNKAYIYGTKGKIEIPNFWSAEQVFIYNIDQKLIKEITHPYLVNGFEYEILEVDRCISNHLLESPIMNHQTTLEIMKQMDQLRHAWGLVFPQER